MCALSMASAAASPNLVARWNSSRTELRVLPDAIDVERALEASAGDERYSDQRLRLDRSAGDETHARIEVRLVREHGLAMNDGPAGDPLAEGEGLAHDLVCPLASREDRDQLTLGLVGLVDVHVLVRDEIGECVCDPREECGRVFLREDVVEDLGQPTVWLGRAGGDEAHLRAGRRVEALGHGIGHQEMYPGSSDRAGVVLSAGSANMPHRGIGGRRTGCAALAADRSCAALPAGLARSPRGCRGGSPRALSSLLLHVGAVRLPGLAVARAPRYGAGCQRRARRA